MIISPLLLLLGCAAPGANSSAHTPRSAVAAQPENKVATSRQHRPAKTEHGDAIVTVGGAVVGAATGAIVGAFAPLATEGRVDIEEGVLGGAVIGASIGGVLTWLRLREDREEQRPSKASP